MATLETKVERRNQRWLDGTGYKIDGVKFAVGTNTILVTWEKNGRKQTAEIPIAVAPVLRDSLNNRTMRRWVDNNPIFRGQIRKELRKL
jgi:hypothetical protein